MEGEMSEGEKEKEKKVMTTQVAEREIEWVISSVMEEHHWTFVHGASLFSVLIEWRSFSATSRQQHHPRLMGDHLSDHLDGRRRYLCRR